MPIHNCYICQDTQVRLRITTYECMHINEPDLSISFFDPLDSFRQGVIVNFTLIAASLFAFAVNV